MNANQGRKSASPTTSSGTSANQKPMQNVGRSGAAQSPARNFVSGHLMNHSLGGQATPTNLTPVTQQMNSQHLRVEVQTQSALRNSNLSVTVSHANNEPQGARSGGTNSSFGKMANVGRKSYE